jgi:hypothetical protein
MYDHAEHIAIAIAIVAMTLALPGTVHAQSDEQLYCAQLSDLYRRYVQNAPGRRGDVEAAVALEDCSKGRAAAAIPVLEKRLRTANITLPGGGEFKP